MPRYLLVLVVAVPALVVLSLPRSGRESEFPVPPGPARVDATGAPIVARSGEVEPAPVHPAPADPGPSRPVTGADRPGPLEAWDDSAWIGRVDSTDPATRALGIDLMPRRPDGRIVAVLERFLAEESDPGVLERAVFAYAESLGRRAVPRLETLALDETASIRTREAAIASLDLVRTIDPAAPRGSVRLVLAGPLQPGAPFEIVVRVFSEVPCPRATLGLVLSGGLDVDGEDASWRGSLGAGEERELRFRLRLAGDRVSPDRITARLKLDFETRLDAEVLEDAILVRAGSGAAPVPVQEPVIELE